MLASGLVPMQTGDTGSPVRPSVRRSAGLTVMRGLLADAVKMLERELLQPGCTGACCRNFQQQLGDSSARYGGWRRSVKRSRLTIGSASRPEVEAQNFRMASKC